MTSQRKITGVPPRDLRVMDPSLAYPSCLMVRERALVRGRRAEQVAGREARVALRSHDRVGRGYAGQDDAQRRRPTMPTHNDADTRLKSWGREYVRVGS